MNILRQRVNTQVKWDTQHVGTNVENTLKLKNYAERSEAKKF